MVILLLPRFFSGKSKCKRRKKYLSKDHHYHSGIKRVRTENINCELLSADSEICICVVTWNMNGKVISIYSQIHHAEIGGIYL